MALPKKTKQLLEENLQYRLGRLDAGDLSLSELVQISEAQERELIQYLMAQPQRKFDKLMEAIGPRWHQYTELRMRNRKRMKELCEGSDQVERAN